MSGMIESFLKYIQLQRRYSPKTVLAYQTDLEQFQQFLVREFEIQDWTTVNFATVRSWVVHLAEQELNPASINRKMACLRSFYKYLMKQGLVEKNPTTQLKVLKQPRRLPHFANETEMIEVLDQTELPEDFETLRDQLILELLYGTGIRLSELIGLREKDISLRDCTLKVLGKRNKERIIPFPAGIVNSIERYQVARKREVERLVPDVLLLTKKGTRMYPMMVQRIVKKYLAATHLEKRSPHVLRHTYATHLLNKGAEIGAVKDLLGHTSLSATQVYTHNTIDKLKKIFDHAHPKA